MNTATRATSMTESSHLSLLYKVSAAAIVVMLAIIIIQFAVFMTAPPPYEGSAEEWFTLFQQNQVAGLIDFELLMVLYVILSILVSLTLYLTLKNASPTLTLLYLVLSLTGVVAFVIARPALEMLSLSNGYAAAATEAEKSIFLAAGQSLLATFNGTAFHVSYILGSLTGLIISFVMLKSQIFSKATAWVRIASSVFDFGLYVPVIGIYISIFSVLFLFIWNILVAIRFLQLGFDSRS